MSSRIQDAAYAIVSAREFCGNEREALRDWQGDNGPLTSAERAAARSEAERIWAGYQLEAGVTLPISPDERREIARILERAD